MTRIPDLGRITSERQILRQHIQKRQNLGTSVKRLGPRRYPNRLGQDVLGLFRKPTARKAVIADMEMLEDFHAAGLKVPSFLEAGPRKQLYYDPNGVRAAIVTTGGLAPGLHRVIHSIVKRHHAYGRGPVFGVYNSFEGLQNLADNQIALNPEMTEDWLYHGGSNLGNVRGGDKDEDTLKRVVARISENLASNDINILYVVGGDGSLKVAHQVALANPERSIVGVPKTMDNDLLWVWQSFGFNTAVEQATRVINVLRGEAESTRRIGVIELFGAEAGFVAANAALASGHVDLVLIPEVFNLLGAEAAEQYLRDAVRYVEKVVRQRPHNPHAIKGKAHNPHAVIVVAEGVETVLRNKGAEIQGVKVIKDSFCGAFRKWIEELVREGHGKKMEVFVNQPRHYIRALSANAHDQIYCERLGAQAVDNALAGYTDFMISQWLAEFVLVPLRLVGFGKKSIPIQGMFWKQVVSSTGQPLSPAERTGEPEGEEGAESEAAATRASNSRRHAQH